MITLMLKKRYFNLCCDYHYLVAFSYLLKDIMFNLSVKSCEDSRVGTTQSAQKPSTKRQRLFKRFGLPVYIL